MAEGMTIEDAMARGLDRVTPAPEETGNYVRFWRTLDGVYGPWFIVHCIALESGDCPEELRLPPQKVLVLLLDDGLPRWHPYTGPISGLDDGPRPAPLPTPPD